MTYKHIKFDESPVMRSLERLEQSKMLKKAEVLIENFINEFKNYETIDKQNQYLKSYEKYLFENIKQNPEKSLQVLEKENEKFKFINSRFVQDKNDEANADAYNFFLKKHRVLLSALYLCYLKNKKEMPIDDELLLKKLDQKFKKPFNPEEFSMPDELLPEESKSLEIDPSTIGSELAKTDEEYHGTAFANSITNNILKLANELRNRGMNKYADELEYKFLMYKKAEYGVIKETGEDLIDSAHPGGSFTFEDVEGKPKVLTVVDRQKEILKTLNKEPKGKIAQAVNQLKKVAKDDFKPFVGNAYLSSVDQSQFHFHLIGEAWSALKYIFESSNKEIALDSMLKGTWKDLDKIWKESKKDIVNDVKELYPIYKELKKKLEFALARSESKISLLDKRYANTCHYALHRLEQFRKIYEGATDSNVGLAAGIQNAKSVDVMVQPEHINSILEKLRTSVNSFISKNTWEESNISNKNSEKVKIIQQALQSVGDYSKEISQIIDSINKWANGEGKGLISVRYIPNFIKDPNGTGTSTELYKDATTTAVHAMDPKTVQSLGALNAFCERYQEYIKEIQAIIDSKKSE